MKILHYLDENLERILLAGMLAVMSVVIGVQVFMRYVFHASLSWSEEVARYLFVWLCYIGISYAVKKNRHIKVDAFALLLPKGGKKFLALLSNAVFLGFAFLVVYESYGVRSMIEELGQASPAMGLPLQWVYTAVPVGFVLVVFRLAQNIYYQIKDFKNSSDVQASGGLK